MELYKYTFRANHDLEGNFENVSLELLEYQVMKETNSGYWIEYWNKTNKKWVPKKGKNLFAFAFKEDALNNFIHRKKRQIRIINFNLKCIKEALELAENKMNL